ncbi:hypothetical protein [Mesorhizobium sp.]|uniref:hypothetical protein n=1 Tax=Mesorhizobium sp. TaxID=1871066 RepID=UPI0025B8AC19|nr:hypothetical protein [Mesorhizobium sp.]
MTAFIAITLLAAPLVLMAPDDAHHPMKQVDASRAGDRLETSSSVRLLRRLLVGASTLTLVICASAVQPRRAFRRRAPCLATSIVPARQFASNTGQARHRSSTGSTGRKTLTC